MKGLLIKDFSLMKGQTRFFIIIVVIAIAIGAFYNNLSFMIGYLPFVISLFTLPTISYDEFDNGNAFLFTLPINRKIYIYEKYCLVFLLGGSSLVLATLLAIIFGITRNIASIPEILITAITILPIMLIIQSVMIPIQLKFGAEKGRIVIIGVSGFLFILGIVIIKATEHLGLDIRTYIDNLPMLSMTWFIVSSIAFAILMLFISMKISIAIMNKKEF